MSRAIAIGAQAQNTGAAQSVDSSTYYWLNQGLSDRVITIRDNVSNPKPAQTTTSSAEDPNVILATKFNTHVKNVYGISDAVYRSGVDPSRNFLIQSATKIKAETSGSTGALVIPLNCNVTLTGISGIMMGNAFLLPDKILPISLRGTGAKTKFGFCVMGLHHTVESNQWITNIKGQIIRLRTDDSSFKSNPSSYTQTSQTTTVIPSGGSSGTNYVSTNSTAKKAAEAYLGRPMTDTEWNQLVAATYAEAGNTRDQKGHVMAVILNRARQNNQSVTDTLYAPLQFEAVTGSPSNGHKPSDRYVDGPTKFPNVENQIYIATIDDLKKIPKTYNGFTALNPNAYKTATGRATLTRYKNLVNIGRGIILFNNNNIHNPDGTVVVQV